VSLKGGQALKQAIHVARARTDMTSDTQLAIRAGVSYDTFMNWFGDKTTPRPAEVKKVADALGIRYAELMAAWEGRPIDPPPLQDAIRELVEELRLSRIQQHEATIALMQAVGSLGRGDRAPRGTPAGTAPGPGAGRSRSRRP
jgi:transcriptional regulator with XRE-family HTH domain